MSETGSGTAASELRGLLGESAIKMVDVAKFIDDLSAADRVVAIRSLGAREQRRLYEAAGGFAPVRLTELVPPDVPDFGTVRHYGKNSLLLFTEFEKRFSRTPDRDPSAPGELIGFNFQTMSPVTGPGYYVAVEDESRGEVLVDYRRVPDQHPEDWPEIRSNERGLSRLVYGSMVDTLRRVSEHVTIGSAARNGKDTGNWFVLCRES
jgi:hypothetical protein